MKSRFQILVLSLVVIFSLQCSSVSKTTTKRKKQIEGTFSISKMVFPDEDITLIINDPEATFNNVVSELKSNDPEIELDSARVRQQVELDLISIGAFRMTFYPDGSYKQSEFFYNNSTAPPFSGDFKVDQKTLLLTDSKGNVYDSYQIDKMMTDRLILRKTIENKSNPLFIIEMERLKE